MFRQAPEETGFAPGSNSMVYSPEYIGVHLPSKRSGYSLTSMSSSGPQPVTIFLVGFSFASVSEFTLRVFWTTELSTFVLVRNDVESEGIEGGGMLRSCKIGWVCVAPTA